MFSWIYSFFCSGVSTGSFIAGLLFDKLSGATVFRICGLAVLVVCVFHICAQFFLSRRQVSEVPSAKGQFTFVWESFALFLFCMALYILLFLVLNTFLLRIKVFVCNYEQKEITANDNKFIPDENWGS